MPEAWCRPTAFVDSDAPAVVAFARDAAGSVDVRERAVALYYAVRDSVTYTPYCDFRSPDTYRASAVLAKGAGFCVGKAALLTAVARAEGIPARLRFADVRNHLSARPGCALSSAETSSTTTATWSSRWNSAG